MNLPTAHEHHDHRTRVDPMGEAHDQRMNDRGDGGVMRIGFNKGRHGGNLSFENGRGLDEDPAAVCRSYDQGSSTVSTT